MATYYVDSGSGNNSNNGTSWGTAAQTIKYAVASLGAIGDTIIISESAQYNEYDISTKENMIIKSKYGEQVVIDGNFTRNDCFTPISSGAYYENLKIRNYNAKAFNNASNGREFSMSGCYIHDCAGGVSTWIKGNSGLTLGIYPGAPETPNGYAIVDRCTFINNDDGAHDGGSTSHLFVKGTHVKVMNSLFVSGRTAYAKMLSSGHNYENTTASFCTFVLTGSVPTNSQGMVQMMRVVNCILSGNNVGVAGAGIHGILAPGGHSNNCVYGINGNHFIDNSKNPVSSGSGDIDGDPLFTGANIQASEVGPLNYTLQSASPCIGAALTPREWTPGIALSLDGSVKKNIDLSGSGRVNRWKDYVNPRTHKNARDFTINNQDNFSGQQKRVMIENDMGAYEYVPPRPYDGGLKEKVDQAPFYFNVKGMMRGTRRPYIVSQGGNPDDLVSE